MPDELLERLRRFKSDAFPKYQFQQLVDAGQRPLTLFIGCSDSRVVPYLLTGAGRASPRAQRRGAALARQQRCAGDRKLMAG